MFPLGTALLPGEPLPLRIFEPRYRRMLADCLDASAGGAARFGVVLIARGSEVGGGEVRNDVGTFAEIETVDILPDGRSTLVCSGSRRFRVVEWLDDDPYPQARVQILPEHTFAAAHAARLGDLGARIRELVSRVAEVRGATLGDSMPAFDEVELRDDDGLVRSRGIYLWAARLPIGPHDRQRLLEAPDADTQLAVLVDAVDGFAAMLEFGI